MHANSLVGKGRMVVVRPSVSLQYLRCFAASREAMMSLRWTWPMGMRFVNTYFTLNSFSRRGGDGMPSPTAFSRRGGDDRPSSAAAGSRRIANKPKVQTTIFFLMGIFYSFSPSRAAPAPAPPRKNTYREFNCFSDRVFGRFTLNSAH